MKRLLSIALGSLLLAACTADAGDGEESVVVNASTSDVQTSVLNPPPPTKCTATQGCGAPIGTPIGGGGQTCASGPKQCFGAIGIDCDGVLPNGWFVPQLDYELHIGCQGNTCWINAGSWQHDECCVTTPGGRWCGGIGSANNSGCVAAWDRANHRLQHGLNWKRHVDICRADGDGLVDFAEYCAPNGTIVASNDVNRCCSGLSRAFSATSDSAIAASQGVTLDGSFVPMLCVAPPPPPAPPPPKAPRPCTSQSQCGADEICIAPSSSTTGAKVCMQI